MQLAKIRQLDEVVRTVFKAIEASGKAISAASRGDADRSSSSERHEDLTYDPIRRAQAAEARAYRAEVRVAELEAQLEALRGRALIAPSFLAAPLSLGGLAARSRSNRTGLSRWMPRALVPSRRATTRRRGEAPPADVAPPPPPPPQAQAAAAPAADYDA